MAVERTRPPSLQSGDASSGPRALVVTPDFPPDRGGIQLLIGRIVSHLREIVPFVVTRRARVDGPDPSGVTIRRTRIARGRASLLEMNALAVLTGLQQRPDVVLAGHITAIPAASFLRRALGCPIVTYLHADEVSAHPGLSRWAMRESAATVAVSRYTEGLALRHGARRDRLVVIPPGVDLPVHGLSGRKAARPTLVTVARLADRYKGHDRVVDAMPTILSSVPDTHWFVVGDGPLRNELQQQVEGTAIAHHVHLLGDVSDAERDSWLARAHVFIMPSRLPDGGMGGEGFGIAYLEAGVFGTPSIAGAVAGATDAVVHGETGLLVDPTRPDEIAQAAVRLLSNADERRRFGEAARVRAERHAWPVIVPRVEDLICSVLIQRGRRWRTQP